MSGRESRPAALSRTLGPLDGARIRGGCDHCDAYQEVKPVVAGLWHLRIYHDHDCPFLAAREARDAA